METYSVTLERGTDGTYLGWVDDLPGCAVRAPSRAELLERLPGEIAAFSRWAGEPIATKPRVVVTEEVGSAIEAEEDTEVLLAYDRMPFTAGDLDRVRPPLARSRQAAWTFERHSTDGLAAFLAWTRRVALDRLVELSARAARDLTSADWAGAPRPEPWSPRKAARRLVWHELLHLRAIERFAGSGRESR